MSLLRLEAAQASAAWSLGLDAQCWALADAAAPADSPRTTGRHGDFPARPHQRARGPMNIIAANDLAPHWVQAVPRSVHSLAELHQVAGTRCAHLFGGQPDDWWVTGDWSTRRPFVCTAVPRAIAVSLRACAAEWGTHARWHTVWGLVCSLKASLFPNDGWSALRGATNVLLWHCNGGFVDCLATIAVAPRLPPAEGAESAWARIRVEQSRADLPGARLHWMDLTGRHDAQEHEPTVNVLPATWLRPSRFGATDAEIALGLGRLLEEGA